MISRTMTFGMIAALACTASTALAEPKGNGAAGCKCTCAAPSGVNNGTILSENTYASVGGSCAAFPGKTCNIDNPNTGGISTGELLWCDPVQGSANAAIKNGALLHGPFQIKQSEGGQHITKPSTAIDPRKLHAVQPQ